MMRGSFRLLSALLVAGPLFACTVTSGAEIRIAVASNFTETMQALAERFEARTSHKVILIAGSTGKLYAQIENGAPYDLYFAADARRPALLEKNGAAVRGSRFTYAIGKLVLWIPETSATSAEKDLRSGNFDRAAIANPKLAPYGRAAREVLQSCGAWQRHNDRIVRGGNVSQAYHFVSTGNADIGFVAYSQLLQRDQLEEGVWWNIPQTLYTPIRQQAVLLSERGAASEFLEFVRSDEGKTLIRDHGYEVP